MKTYQGWREAGTAGSGVVKVVDASGARPLNPRLDLANKSPCGLQWGYAGSGPAQLALALVADATGDDALAVRTFQEFKRRLVARLGPTWALTEDEITGLALAIDREMAQ